MRSVVALELETDAAIAAQAQNGGDVAIGVFEHQIAAAFEVLDFPVVFEILEAFQHREQAEIHRAHVERGDFGLDFGGRTHAFLDRHIGAAAGSDIDRSVGALDDHRQELAEPLRVLGRLAVVRIACMQMQDRGAGIGSLDRRVGDFARRDRQPGRHGRGVDGAGHGAGNDDLALLRHGCFPSYLRLSCNLRQTRLGRSGSSLISIPNGARASHTALVSAPGTELGRPSPMPRVPNGVCGQGVVA